MAHDPKRPGAAPRPLRSSDPPNRRVSGGALPCSDSAGEPGGASPGAAAPSPGLGAGGRKSSQSSLSPRHALLRRRPSVEPDARPQRASAGDPGGPPDPRPFVAGGWMLRTAESPPRADNRRDSEGNTPLMRAAHAADYTGMVDLLSIPGTDVAARNSAGQGAYDLLRRAVSDRSCPEFTVISQALFLRTMLGLLIREEHFANLARGHPVASPRLLAKKVIARLSGTYSSQTGDRALPFAATPSLDFVEAAILALQ